MVNKKVEKNIISTIDYFTFFKYPPNFAEIHTFHPTKINILELQNNLNSLRKSQKIRHKKDRLGTIRYTPREYPQILELFNKRTVVSAQKGKSAEHYINLLAKFPHFKLIGLSGSVAMRNANREDDVDLFVVTAQNRLWTARFISLLIASLLGRRRKRGEEHVHDKLCLNLFFEETGMIVPSQKRTRFVAHEVLQMKPIFDRKNTYRRFLEANKWVFRLFPNAPRSTDKFLPPNTPPKKNLLSSLGDFIEFVLKKLQLFFINRHKTSEIITDKQLWFFPDDFEKKISGRF